MGVRTFLHFERIKLLLPAALIVIFGLLILLKPGRTMFDDALSYLFNGTLFKMEDLYQWYFLTPIHQVVYGTPFIDIPIFIVILFVSGYLLSSAVLWVHRANGAIYNRGGDVYYALAVSIVVMFAAFYASDVDAMWSLIFASILSYILVTYAWKYYDQRKAGKITKMLKRERKLVNGSKNKANR